MPNAVVTIAVKSVKQNYTPSEQLLHLLNDFRLMVNDCIRIGMEESNATSLKSLSLKAYHQLSNYEVPTYYRLCAISAATGILKNYRKASRKKPNVKTPYARRLMLTTCYGFKIKNGEQQLRLSVRPRLYEYIQLNQHTKDVLFAEPGLTVRSICLTTSTISISYSKQTNDEIEPAGLLGIDRNLDNITVATTSGEDIRFDLSKATETKARYRNVKSHFTRNDVKVRRRIYGKYGEKQRNRVNQLIHNVSKQVVKKAKDEKLGIVMENIKGIRKLYRRGNGQGSNHRGKMNSWSYYELQRQIEYKAKWEGIPVVYVDARGTSSKCSICGCKTYPNEHRLFYCPKCNISVDRDVNAAKNILARGGLRFGPDGRPVEAMVSVKR